MPSLKRSKSRVNIPIIILNCPRNPPRTPSTKSENPFLIVSASLSNPNNLGKNANTLPTAFTNPPTKPSTAPIKPSRNNPIIPSSLNPLIAPLIPPIRAVITAIAIPIGPASLAKPVPKANILDEKPNKFAKNVPTAGRPLRNVPIALKPVPKLVSSGPITLPIFANSVANT